MAALPAQGKFRLSILLILGILFSAPTFGALVGFDVSSDTLGTGVVHVDDATMVGDTDTVFLAPSEFMGASPSGNEWDSVRFEFSVEFSGVVGVYAWFVTMVVTTEGTTGFSRRTLFFYEEISPITCVLDQFPGFSRMITWPERKIEIVNVTESMITISVIAADGQPYTIQKTEDLVIWSPVGDQAMGTGLSQEHEVSWGARTFVRSIGDCGPTPFGLNPP